MDKRINNGGARDGAGRKSKSTEQRRIEVLTPLEEFARIALKEALERKEPWAVKLFFDYSFSKPQQRLDITSNEETINLPLITFIDTESN